jgi:uncharacterized protein
MKMLKMPGWLGLIAAAAAVSVAVATEAPAAHKAEWQGPVERPMLGNFVGEPGVSPELMTEGFLSAHPDLRWRREGLHAYTHQDYQEAMNCFLRAARYADKPAQAMIAEMYWEGIGVRQDRALGYAWMDLAAERFYANFIILREKYWEQLDGATRADAIERGQPLMAEFGDAAAKPRMARILRKHRMMTGSRVGFVGNLEIIPRTGPLSAGALRIRAEDYYAPEYWRPELYFEWQDRQWDAPPPQRGRVRVGEAKNASVDD